MAQPDLRIPEHYIPGIESLIALNQSQVESLLSALQSEEPVFYLPKELSAHVASKVRNVELASISSIISALTGLYTARAATGLSVGEFAEGLFAAVEKQELRPSDDSTWDRFRKNVLEILALGGALAVASKALNVVTEQERVFCDARVLTDLRSVFKEDPKESPSAMAIIHQLRINYHQRGEPLRSFFLALDDRDIVKLQELLVRAQEKSRTLKNVAKSAQIPIINIAGEFES